MDLEAIKEKWLNLCGACDVGMYGCTHPQEDYRPVMLELVREIERMQAERKAEIARVVREVVELATAEISPEWVLLVRDVHEGKYTPREAA